MSNFNNVALATGSTSGRVTSFVPRVKSSIKTVSSAGYTILTNDGYSTVAVSTSTSNRTVTLPDAATNIGRIITVTKTDSDGGVNGKILVTRAGSDTIRGTSSAVELSFVNSSVTLIAGSSNWYILSHFNRSPVVSGTLTCANSGFSTTYCDVQGIQEIDNTYLLYINLAFTQSSTAVANVTVTGISVSLTQCLSGSNNASTGMSVIASSTNTIQFAGVTPVTTYNGNGTLILNAKPTVTNM